MSAEDSLKQPEIQENYGEKYGSNVPGPVQRRIRREAYGDEYPEDIVPQSFVTRAELHRIAQELQVGPGQTFVDLGCGQGGPGLWLSRETGSSVVGLDVSHTRVELAALRAQDFGVADRARFEVADFVATGLPASSVDGAVSLDVIWVIPDKVGAMHEVARILKSGARFVFTNWDRDLTPPGYLPPLNDHRPLLQDAGFAIEAYDIQRQEELMRRAYYEKAVLAEQDLIREMGDEAAERLMFEAKTNLGITDGTDYLAHNQRIFVVARKL